MAEKRQVIIHVAGLGKFIPPFLKLVRDEFNKDDHRFWFLRAVEKHPIGQDASVYVCGNGFRRRLQGYANLIRQLHFADKIIIHGLFSTHLVFILALCPWVLKKAYWMILGGDLYKHINAGKSLSSRVEQGFRRHVVSRIGNLVTYIEGDVDLARKWYGAKGTYRECLMYLSNVVSPSVASIATKCSSSSKLTILLGNSADPANNHIEALELLKPYRELVLNIYTPLSYGDQGYANTVIAKGEEWFGEKFLPLTDFMPLDQYMKILEGVDIAIFNHRRQQAMGNTITLLGMGKTVYMRSDVSHWRLLSGLGVKINDVERLTLQVLPEKDRLGNAQIIRRYFSRETLIKQLSEVFEV